MAFAGRRIQLQLRISMGVSMNEDEKIDNELDWFLSEQTWEEYFNEGYEEIEHE